MWRSLTEVVSRPGRRKLPSLRQCGSRSRLYRPTAFLCRQSGGIARTLVTFSQKYNSGEKYSGCTLTRISPTRLLSLPRALRFYPRSSQLPSCYSGHFATYVQRGPGPGLDNHVEVHHIPHVNILLSLLTR